MTFVFRKKIPFPRQKFLMTFFLVMDQVFQILRFFTVSNVVYDPFFTRKTTISEKNSLITPFFLLCSYFHVHPTTLLLKILGGGDGCMGLERKFLLSLRGNTKLCALTRRDREEVSLP